MLAEALAPILSYTLFGMALRASGVVKADLAPTLFRFIFVATLPMLVFSSIARAPLDADAALLPFAGFLSNSGSALGAYVFGRWRRLSNKDTLSLVLSSSVINMMLMFPFMLYGIGESGLRDALLFDIGNAVFTATVASAIAYTNGRDGEARIGRTLLDMLTAPIFIGLVAALVINLGDLSVPSLVYRITEPLGRATIPLILVALGIALSPSAFRRPLPLAPVFFRMAIGLVLGVVLAALFGLEGMTRWVVIASAGAPIGAGSVALTAIGRFDVERATAAVTLSVAIGFLSVTALLWMAGQMTG